ncbi:putative zinc metalloprotease [Mycena olivaceomarginata]|nr:putative zinc metalloprotease [Mycena olivaceomarginata]
MTLVEGIAKVFAFRTLPATVLAVLVYLVLFGAVQYGDRVPKVPKNQKGLDLAQAYADLHRIAERPHPMLSHANDIVHTYILDRVRNISLGVEYIEVYDDIVSDASWAAWGGRGAAVYNEATNILVKIQGSDPEYTSGDGGVLFSAHYDSVSTASGATDDGMGVATLIQLVEYLAKNRPKRTAVFNINNGEEDGLLGAFAFLKHPWSNLTDVFLNLEGASAGGRPLLFRGTSTPALRSFNVPHPHGNSFSADAFERGVIRSGTDYTVYTGVGMEGLDLAFYRGRSKYHTKYDAIPYTDAQERALWAMMESAHASGLALLNDDRTHGTGRPPVYFDLFGAWLVLLSMDTLLIVNVVLIIVGPVILIVLVIAEGAILHGRSQNRNGHVSQDNSSLLQQFWTWLIAFGWLKGAWRWAKFWVAVLVTLGLQALLILAYLKFNPFKQKHIMFLQTYILTWSLLIWATVAAWNVSVLLACAIGCVENMLGAQGSYDNHHVHYAPLPQTDDEEHPRAEVDAETTETTPLIRPILRTKEESGAIGWWILQFLLAVSVPVTLVSHIAILFISATAQTLADGSSAVTVYAGVSFTFKIHSAVASLFIIVFVFSTAYNLLTFPFSQTEPLKIFFQQTVALGNISSLYPQITHATTKLTGVDYYLKDIIIPKLPSAIGQNVTCSTKNATRLGLQTCSWESALLPSPGGHDSLSSVGADHWITANVTRRGTNSARFRITRHNVRGSEGGVLPQFPLPRDGVNLLHLWAREWDRTFSVDVEWEGDGPLEGQLACKWAEYESGSVGVDAATGKIPAFEEALTWFPRWAAVTKGADGLVEAFATFSV